MEGLERVRIVYLEGHPSGNRYYLILGKPEPYLSEIGRRVSSLEMHSYLPAAASEMEDMLAAFRGAPRSVRRTLSRAREADLDTLRILTLEAIEGDDTFFTVLDYMPGMLEEP